MGTTSSTPAAISQCLLAAVGGNSNLVAFPNDLLYEVNSVHRYNLDIPITPAAVTFPESVEQVAAIVKCAADANYKVQAKSGGHSYGNYGMNRDMSLRKLKPDLTKLCSQDTEASTVLSSWI